MRPAATGQASAWPPSSSTKLGGGLRTACARTIKARPLDIEFLIDDPVTERIIGPYAGKLADLGIKASLRRVDPAQEQERLKRYDFDIVTQRFSLSPTPGPETQAFWNSDAGREDGSYNLAGIADPVVDALIDKILTAKSRDELRTACHAIDRVLRAGHYWVPEWYKPVHTIATWDKYSRPAVQAKYDNGILDTWWYDKEKAAKLGG